MDDLLLAEFHEAGIYLPEELEAIDGNTARWVEQMRGLDDPTLEVSGFQQRMPPPGLLDSLLGGRLF